MNAVFVVAIVWPTSMSWYGVETHVPQRGLAGICSARVGLPADRAVGGLRAAGKGVKVNGFRATASVQLFRPLMAEATSPLFVPVTAGKLMLGSPL